MYQLPNGCLCSQIKVTPKNWMDRGASTKENWVIYYRFHDPSMSGPKQVHIKSGINHIKDLTERRMVVKQIIEDEYYRLKELGYNPFTGLLLTPAENEYEIHPDTGLAKALEAAKEKLTVSEPVKRDMKAALKVINKAALQLHYDRLPISKTSIRHLVRLMEKCGELNPKWSARRHNMYRSYLIMLFKRLVKLEAVPANPAYELDRMPEVKKIRDVLTPSQREQVKKHLEIHAPQFLKFVHLFFHSGGRKTELMQQTTKTVNLETQKYKAVIKKGKQYVEVERTIKDVALPYWEYFLKGAEKGDYLFGVGFKPGKKPMVPTTIGRWWERLIKNPKTGLGIDVDFYSLKHLHTSEVVDLMGEDEGTKAAAEHNAHTSEAMVVSIYDVRREDRKHSKLKKLGNAF